MLVKITDFPDHLIADLKASTGQATASKAVFFAASNYAQLATEAVQLGFDCLEKDEEISRLYGLLAAARYACAQVLEVVNQRDLFEKDA